MNQRVRMDYNNYTASITNYYYSISANTNYTTNGYSYYNGYAIDTAYAILISGLSDQDSHGVDVSYTASNGVYYYTTLSFVPENT